jgi:hypothetical protein
VLGLHERIANFGVCGALGVYTSPATFNFANYAGVAPAHLALPTVAWENVMALKNG